MGSTTTVFMVLNGCTKWWYQRLIQHRFTEAVKETYMPRSHHGAPNGDKHPRPNAENTAVLTVDQGGVSAEE